MKILSVGIRGYRSLYDVDVSMQELSVLTGANNSGKTNFVEAVEFIGEAHRLGVELAVNRKGGIENIAHRRIGRSRRALQFDVVASLDWRDLRSRRRLIKLRHPSQAQRTFTLRHRFQLRPRGQAIEADFDVARESLVATERTPGKKPRRVFSVERDEGEFRFYSSRASALSDLVQPFGERAFRDFIKRNTESTDLITEPGTFNPIIDSFNEAIGETRLYQVDPIEARRSGVPTPNAALTRHGSNLPAMVAYLRKHDQKAWQQVLDAMKRIVPGLADVETAFTPDRRLTLQFAEHGVRRPWSIEDVSDGTIRSLALFSALLDTRTPLLLLEEPENAVHPWIVRNFLDLCRSSVEKQVMITTHSPALLTYVEPRDVLIAWRRRGRTAISKLLDLDPDAEWLWSEGRSTLFEILDSGAVPEAVPSDE